MGTQLQRDLKSPGSPFQMFLKYSPDALNHLFDRWNTWQKRVLRTFCHVRCMMNIFRCMMKPVDLQLQGRLFFDLFLFAPCHQTGCELGKWFGFFAFLEFVLLNNFALRHYCGHFGRKEGEVPFAPNLWPVSAGRRSVMTLWYSDNLKHTAEVGKDCKNLLLLALYHPCLWGGHFLRFLHGLDQTRLIEANTFATIVLSMTWILSQAVFFVFTLQQFSCFKEIIPATPMFIVMIVR